MWSALTDLMGSYNERLRKRQAALENRLNSMTLIQRDTYTTAYNRNLQEYARRHEEIRRKRDEKQALQKQQEDLLKDLEDINSEHYNPLLAKRIKNNE